MRIECKYDEIMPLKEIEKRWHPDNENSHPEEQVRSLAKVIAKIGIRHAIHISKQSGKISGGHGRYLAFKKLGYDSAPIVWEHFKDEIEELNYRASDNLGQYAEFNNHEYVLNLEKAGLDLKDIDLEEFGVIDFEIPEIESLDPQSDEDEVPEVAHPITRRGDIWLLGKHRVMCGDSTMIDDVEKLMKGEKADMVFTDPPYNVDFKGQDLSNTTIDGKKVLNHKGANTKHDAIKNDCMEKDDFYTFMCEVLTNIKTLNPKSWYFSFFDLKLEELLNPLRASGYNWKSIIIWKKNQATLSGKDFKSRYEPIVYGCDSGAFYGERYKQEDIWEFQRTLKNDLHPTMKPIPLIENALNNSSKISNLIIDLFLGSGSTLIACEKTNRKCYGMELDEKYCDVIINRWQNYTGKKATLESSGQTYEELKNERL